MPVPQTELTLKHKGDSLRRSVPQNPDVEVPLLVTSSLCRGSPTLSQFSPLRSKGLDMTLLVTFQPL